ncbi:GAF domain-containing protein [Cytophagaceae bacterium YF14B1]|uniref:GAF domain-containing protein n=1 Tax=Xanthocytophaga flava TaxID=3048013 RepID=A0AAE3U9G6_9BACT|nr:GAF domain-containing protein [Xanthocytophaga flavus]MDJ1485084.1 GAF domain-containing protein [Xanthocytophaga flavus]
MGKLFAKLSIGKRLLLIVYISLSFFLLIGFIVWYNGIRTETMGVTIQQYSYFRTDVSETKRFYNALRGDLGFAFIVNPQTEPEKAARLAEWFKSRRLRLKELTDRLHTYKSLTPEIEEAKMNFISNVEKFTNLSQTNFDKVLSATSSDSVQYQTMKNFLFGEYSDTFQSLLSQAQILEDRLSEQISILFLDAQAQRDTVKWGTLFFILIIGLLLFLISNIVIKTITIPVNQAKSNLEQLSEGELPDVIPSENKDEVSRMIGSLYQLVSNQKQLMDFTRQVAQNNFSVEASMYNGKGPIVQALLQMRNSLKESAQKEAQKNWHNEGLSKLSQLLRNKNMDHQTLHATLIQFMVKYVKANQGSIFHVVEEDKQLYLDVVATYAYERRKYQKKRLEWGEGLIGASCQERDIIYLTDIPDDYVQISSGLGTASPTCLLIVPFLSEQGVEGALEIASFQPLESYQIAFLQEACNAIAAELTILKTNQKIQQLLAQSQLQAEELRAQEEEMRQNMEELAATQEEMERKTREMEDTLSQFSLKERVG